MSELLDALSHPIKRQSELRNIFPEMVVREIFGSLPATVQNASINALVFQEADNGTVQVPLDCDMKGGVPVGVVARIHVEGFGTFGILGGAERTRNATKGTRVAATSTWDATKGTRDAAKGTWDAVTVVLSGRIHALFVIFHFSLPTITRNIARTRRFLCVTFCVAFT